MVRNASNNSDTADCDKALGELLFDEDLAVHIENLAGGPLHSGRRAVTPNPNRSTGRCRSDPTRATHSKSALSGGIASGQRLAAPLNEALRT